MGYTLEQRTEAVELADEFGPAEASRRTKIPKRTISSWREPAHAGDEKTAAAREVAAERVATAWGDFRAQEALAAGAAANRMRREALEASTERNAGLLRARIIAYGIFIDKAELLSGQATERIQVWAESEVDRELREAMRQLEDRIREG